MTANDEKLIPPEIMADLERAARLAASGQRAEDDFVQRIADQASQIRDQVKQEHGLLDIGVPAIRELRDA